MTTARQELLLRLDRALRERQRQLLRREWQQFRDAFMLIVQAAQEYTSNLAALLSKWRWLRDALTTPPARLRLNRRSTRHWRPR